MPVLDTLHVLCVRLKVIIFILLYLLLCFFSIKVTIGMTLLSGDPCFKT